MNTPLSAAVTLDSDLRRLAERWQQRAKALRHFGLDKAETKAEALSSCAEDLIDLLDRVGKS